MFCPKCGNQINEGAAFCNKCGTPVSAGAAQAPAVPVAQAPAYHNTYSPAPAQHVAPVGGVAVASKPNGNKTVIIIGIVVVILAVIAFFAFNAIKENKEEQERLAQLQADRNAAYSAISGYADAISKLDFNGSDDYCVPGSNPIKDMLEVIPGADYIFGGASLLGGITGIEFEFNLDVSESDIEISDSGDRATAPVTVSIPQLDYEKDVTITLEKDGGDWLISSAR